MNKSKLVSTLLAIGTAPISIPLALTITTTVGVTYLFIRAISNIRRRNHEQLEKRAEKYISEVAKDVQKYLGLDELPLIVNSTSKEKNYKTKAGYFAHYYRYRSYEINKQEPKNMKTIFNGNKETFGEITYVCLFTNNIYISM